MLPNASLNSIAAIGILYLTVTHIWNVKKNLAPPLSVCLSVCLHTAGNLNYDGTQSGQPAKTSLSDPDCYNFSHKTTYKLHWLICFWTVLYPDTILDC